MWTVFEHRQARRNLKKLPEEILKRYEKWKDIVTISGPPGLRQIKGFHDEALTGQRKGERSSRLGSKYRVIYTIEHQQVRVLVVNVNAHDCRSK